MRRGKPLETMFACAWVFLVLLFSSCSIVPRTHLGEKTVAAERIELKSTEEEQIWQTGQLAIHYTMVVSKGSFDIYGFVKVDTSITYTFPAAEYLRIYLYLLDDDGVALSRHTILPNIMVYSTFTDKAGFRATIDRTPQVSAIAFGYLGNFFSVEAEEWGGRRGYEKLEWEIYHDPFP